MTDLEKQKVSLTTAVTVGAFVAGIIASGAFWLAMLSGSVSNANAKNDTKNAEQDAAIKELANADADTIKIINKNTSDLRLIKDRLGIKD
jgi:hypothetical protein